MPNITNHVVIACDHGGIDGKQAVIDALEELGISYDDLGTHSTDSVDYPDFAEKACQAIKNGNATMGVLLCGSGIGISIAANRHPFIRCALCHDETTATLSRQHNNANVIAFGARLVSPATITAATKAFFTTEFEGGRHQNRIDKMS